jgi:hypothetical protein
LHKNKSLIYKKQQRLQLPTQDYTNSTVLWNSTTGMGSCYSKKRDTFLNAYKVLSFSPTKETTFQTLNRTIWAPNKAFTSGMAPDPMCLQCEESETMEHLLYTCANYSPKIWVFVRPTLTLALSRCTEEYIPSITLTPLENVYNEAPPLSLTPKHGSPTKCKSKKTPKVKNVERQNVKWEKMPNDKMLNGKRRRKDKMSNGTKRRIEIMLKVRNADWDIMLIGT